MSTCPEKELLSAYADNEIFSPWSERIEEHAKTCVSCSADIRRYRKIRSVLKTDAVENTLDKTELDEGFARLKARMSYKEVVDPPKDSIKLLFLRRVLPAMAAAAVFAWILPIQMARTAAQNHGIAGFSRKTAQPLPKNIGVISDGTITHAELASMIGRPADPQINVTLPSVPLLNTEGDLSFRSDDKRRIYINITEFLPYTEKTVFERINHITYIPEINF